MLQLLCELWTGTGKNKTFEVVLQEIVPKQSAPIKNVQN